MPTSLEAPAASAMASDSSPPDARDLVQDETPSGNQPTKTSRQRFKPQLSCTLCRSRKLKCDRQLPCGNCVKRSLSASCTFVHGNLREKSAHIQKTNSTRDVQSQIQHLEELVISMMNRASKTASQSSESGSHTTPPSLEPASGFAQTPDTQLSAQQTSESDLNSSAENFGRISIEDNQSNYVGHSHWAAILDNIAGLKDSLESSDPAPQETVSLSDTQGPDLLVGSVPRASRAEILTSLPPRPVVDSLVATYLSLPDMGSVCVHRPTFNKEFEKFWADPGTTPITWVGLLFSIICLSTHFERMTGTNSLCLFEGHVLRDQVEAVQIFRQKTVQCLILGNYTEPDQYTVPTLILYYIAEHFRTADTQFGTWMVFGLIIRASMRLGFHRDASHYPKVSVFRGEMQRRLWDSILFFDLQTSLQVGLPRMIREGTYDTLPPRNLLDDDFSESTMVLPPGRPDHEITPIGYSKCKHRLGKTLGQIVDQANSTNPIPYHEVMILDQRLHNEQAQTPEILSIQSVEDLQVGRPETRLRKFAIDLTFQKARCVLHRKFFFPSKATGTYPYPYSVKSCVEAAMRILQSQNIMYSETLPGKKLQNHRWKASSLLTHDFLLAAMLICLYLGNSLTTRGPEQESPQTDIRISWTRENMLHTLNGSYEIWQEISSTSKEATKAAKALKTMLERVKKASSFSGGAPALQTTSRTALSPGGFPTNTQFPPNHSTQTGESSPWTAEPPYVPQSEPTNSNYFQPTPQPAPPTAASTSEPFEFDWEIWDTHFQPNSLADTPPELWSFDLDPSLTDPNANFMQWDQL